MGFLYGRSSVLTGSYNNYFHIFDREGQSDIILQADKSAFKAKRSQGKTKGPPRPKTPKREEINVEAVDFGKKILHGAWHPRENSIAIAATNNLFIFSQN